MPKEDQAPKEPTQQEKAQLIQKLRDYANSQNLTEMQKEYCTDVCLDIHLRARKWNLDKACAILKESLDWRLEHEPLLKSMVCPGCQKDPSKHYFRRLGKDHLGRPVIYTTAACYFDITLDHSYEHNIIEFEIAVKSMDPSVEQFVYIADLFNCGYSKLDLKNNISFFRTIQAPFRGRLGQLLLIDPPSAINLGLKLIKPFLKAETLAKVMYVDAKEIPALVTPILGPEVTQALINEVAENHDKEKADRKSVV